VLELEYLHTITLPYAGTAHLLGVTAEPHQIFVEQVYGEGNWVTQAVLRVDGTILASADEEYGVNASPEPLPLPDGIKRPASGWHSMTLNTGGTPDRGLIKEDRVLEAALPLRTPDKALLIELGYVPPVEHRMILGIVGSYVHSESRVRRGLYLLTRTLRIAVRMENPEIDADGTPFDYMTRECSIVQTFEPQQPNETLASTLVNLPEPKMGVKRPTDLVIRDGLLFLAEAGFEDESGSAPGRVHLWGIVPVEEPPDLFSP
jgi:hypothetical protein